MKSDFLVKTAKIIADVRARTCIEDVDIDVLEDILNDALHDCYDDGYDDGRAYGYTEGNS